MRATTVSARSVLACAAAVRWPTAIWACAWAFGTLTLGSTASDTRTTGARTWCSTYPGGTHAWSRANTGCTYARSTYTRRHADPWRTNANARCNTYARRTNPRAWQHPNPWGANINWACHAANGYAGAGAIHDLSGG